MRIAIIISTLGCGGAEGVVSRMSERWATNGRDVTIVCIGRAGTFRKLDDRVKVVELDMLRESRGRLDSALRNMKRAVRLRRALLRIGPDVAISFMDTTNVLALLASLRAQWGTIVCERSVPSEKPLGRPWRYLRRLLYPSARAVVVQSRSAARGLPGRLKILPNFVAPVKGGDETDVDENLVVAMGRLSDEKGYDLLLRSMALVRERKPSAKLSIWGDGEERLSLERLAASLGLSDSVSFPGITRHPEKSFQAAQVYALSSRYEGFPNALCQAMAAGVPAVAFACPGGVPEIVRHDLDGILVDSGSVEALADGLLHFIGDRDRRRRFGARAREITERFSEHRVMSLWEGLLCPVKHGR